MAKILNNNTAGVISIADAATDIPVEGYTIPDSKYARFAASSDVITSLAAGDLTLNDGSQDLSLVNATVSLQCGFPVSTRMDTEYAGDRAVFRAESRPMGYQHYFTSRGDSATDIGDGTAWTWDFANADNDITAPAGFKRKRIDMTFKDEIYPKEGSVYFHNAPKGCYIDMFMVCPDQAYYINHSGVPTQASGDTVIEHYAVAHPIQGECPMGDELNTESATVSAVPAGYIFRIEITTPDTDSSSNGTSELEVYRTRTALHPGESI